MELSQRLFLDSPGDGTDASLRSCCRLLSLHEKKSEAFLAREISQLPKRDGEHRKIDLARGMKVGNHLPAAFQPALVLCFPLVDESIRHLHIGAEFQDQSGELC